MTFEMLTYGIDDGDGNQITTGLQGVVAQRVAQREADERGEPVYVYALSGSESATGEWEADESWTVEPSSWAGTRTRETR